MLQGGAVFHAAGKERYRRAGSPFQHTIRYFPHQCLGIGLAFSGDNQTGVFYGLVKADQVQDTVDAGDHPGLEAGHERPGQTAGSPRAGHVADIGASGGEQSFGHPDHALLQHRNVPGRCSLLRGEDGGGTFGPYKRGIDITQQFKSDA